MLLKVVLIEWHEEAVKEGLELAELEAKPLDVALAQALTEAVNEADVEAERD